MTKQKEEQKPAQDEKVEAVVAEVMATAVPAKSKRKVLSFAEIEQSQDTTLEELEVPEWGGVIFLRRMTSTEVAAFVDISKDKDKEKDQLELLAIMSVVDEKGNFLFTTEHIPMLKKKSYSAMMRIQRACLALNGLSVEAKVEAKNA